MKKSTTIIAVDCGKMNLKVMCKGMKMLYANKFSVGKTDAGIIGDLTFNVTYSNREYTIGKNGSSSIATESKSSDMHIISALTAITHFIPENGASVYLMYGESVNMYFNAKHKQSIIEKLEGRHQIEVDGKLYDFTIEHVHILPEGIGHIIDDLRNNMGIQYVVDIGGTTVNFLTVNNSRPSNAGEGSTSFPLGVHNIVAKVRQKLSVEGVGRYSPELITQFLEQGAKNEDVEDIIRETIFEQFKEIDRELDTMGINIHDLLKIYPVTFIGGGSDLLRTYIKQYYVGSTVIEDGVWANVKGFYKYGLAKFGSKIKATSKEE